MDGLWETKMGIWKGGDHLSRKLIYTQEKRKKVNKKKCDCSFFRINRPHKIIQFDTNALLR